VTGKQIYKYIFLIILSVTFISCKSTRWVKDGEYLLMDNEIYINNKRVKKEELQNILKQEPNRHLTRLFRPYLYIYNMGNPNKEKGISHWFTKIGEAPVIADSNSTFASSRQLGLYTFSLGFFNNTTAVSSRKDSAKKKIWMRYDIYTGDPYYFGQMDYLIASDNIEELVKANHDGVLVKAGEQYDASFLDGERMRLVHIFRNHGYYGFQKELIRFEADTTGGHFTVNLKMVISDQPLYYKDSTYYREHRPDTIEQIIIDPSYSYVGKQVKKDTVYIDNYAILVSPDDRFKPELVIDAVHFKPGDEYNEATVRESYDHISSLRVFRSSEILFQKDPNDVNNLKAVIRLKPFPKRSITLDLEGTTTAGNYGILGSISILNRNLFKRGEIFDITVRGGLEAQANLSSPEENNTFNTYEYGVEFGVNFPRFLMPAKLRNRFPKKIIPKSRISTSIGNQHRQEFDRRYFNIGLGYFWKKSETISMGLQLFDFNYLNVDADEKYLASLEFTQGYKSVLISATRYTFTFNNQKVSKDINASFFMGSFEISGNVLNLIDNIRDDAEKRGTFSGVEYAQYFKIGLDYRNYTRLNSNHHIVWRVYGGYTHTYGNTKGLPPFEKSFFAGGSNDVRGWFAYKLGPGNYPKDKYNYEDADSVFIYSATGPIKLMLNIEYRFAIIGNFKGAAFMDFGNIWIYNRDYKQDDDDIPASEIEDLVFNFKNITKQIAMSPGLGIRYDFGFFVFRLDAAYKLYDPGAPNGHRLTPDPFNFRTINYNLAIGYPF